MDSVFNINVCVANLYRENDFDSPIVTQALLGESCAILDESEKWLHIRQSDDYEGWINKFYGIVSDVPYDSNRSCNDLRGLVFSDSHSNNPLREITFGAKLNSEKLDQGWSVILPDGTRGWTHSNLLDHHIHPNRDNAITIGNRFKGVQYLWGGKSPKGFDCSGLIQTIYSAMGIFIPRDSGDQSHYFIHHKINRKEAQPGDLHFFGTEKSVTHVAMEIEQGQYLHCQGWVKEESFDRNKSNYNKNLETNYLHTVSTERCLNQNH
jgi:hypothetical protein